MSTALKHAWFKSNFDVMNASVSQAEQSVAGNFRGLLKRLSSNNASYLKANNLKRFTVLPSANEVAYALNKS